MSENQPDECEIEYEKWEALEQPLYGENYNTLFRAGWNARSKWEEKKQKNQKPIIDEMTDALIFALNFWKYDGSLVSGVNKTPIRWFASILEKVDVKFDPKDLDALHFYAKEKREYFNNKEKAKKSKNV